MARFIVMIGIVVYGVLAVSSTAPAADAQPTLEPGLWRITVQSTTNGKPDPDQDATECLDDELKDIAAYFAPQLEGAEAKCTRTRQPSNDPGTLTYRMECEGQGFTMNALTSAVFEHSRKFSVTMEINSRSEQESAIVVAKGEGNWVSACP